MVFIDIVAYSMVSFSCNIKLFKVLSRGVVIMLFANWTFSFRDLLSDPSGLCVLVGNLIGIVSYLFKDVIAKIVKKV